MTNIRIAMGVLLAILLLLSSCSPGGRMICSDYLSSKGCGGGTYRVTSPFGRVITRHEGIDFRGSPGTSVISATHGTVYAIAGSICGGIVLVKTDIDVEREGYDNPLPLFARYAHVVPSDDLKQEKAINPGDLLGAIQDPNTIPGKNQCVGPVPHVHFALHVFPLAEQLHYNPHDYWADGPGKVTCHKAEQQVPKGKIVAPLRC